MKIDVLTRQGIKEIEGKIEVTLEVKFVPLKMPETMTDKNQIEQVNKRLEILARHMKQDFEKKIEEDYK